MALTGGCDRDGDANVASSGESETAVHSHEHARNENNCQTRPGEFKLEAQAHTEKVKQNCAIGTGREGRVCLPISPHDDWSTSTGVAVEASDASATRIAFIAIR